MKERKKEWKKGLLYSFLLTRSRKVDERKEKGRKERKEKGRKGGKEKERRAREELK